MACRLKVVGGLASVLRNVALCAVLALACVVAVAGCGVPPASAITAGPDMPGTWGEPAGNGAKDALAEGPPAVAPSAASADGPVLRIGFSTSSPPYVDVRNRTGLEPTLVAAVLARSGYRLTPVFLPHARALEQVRKGALDGCGPVGRHADVTGLFLGAVYVQYRNVAVSLEAAGLDIRALEDLRDLTVTAFHNARVFMGPEFAAMADANPRYEELVDQQAQVEAFFRRRDRVIVLDERIFAWHRDRMAASGVLPPVRVHRIFPAQDRFFVFRDPAVRDAFDTGLRGLKEDGEYERLVR